MRRSVVIDGIAFAMRAMAKKKGITLQIGGDTACTNGKDVIIPALPEGNKEMIIKARGYVDHETGHILYTDFSIPITKWINILEDVRVELKHGRKYLGVSVNTRELMELLVKEGYFKAQDDDPKGMLLIWTLSRIRNRVLNQEALAVREHETECYCRELFGDTFCDKIASIVDRVRDAQSTADCKNLADEIEQLIKQSVQDVVQKSSHDDENSNGSDQADASYHASEKSETEPDQADRSEQESVQSAGQTDEGDEDFDQADISDRASGKSEMMKTDQASDTEQLSSQTGEADQGAESYSKALQSILEKEAEVETDIGNILQKDLDNKVDTKSVSIMTETVSTESSKLAGHDDPRLKNFKMESIINLQKTGKLRSQLQGLFQAEAQKHGYSVQTGHHLNRRHVHLIAVKTPDNRVFSTHQKIQKRDTAISILLDASGSMKGDTIDLALHSVYAVSKCIEMMQGVTCNIGVFPWQDNESCILEIKKFGTKPDMRRFCEVDADGDTPLAHAIMWGGQQLSFRKEQRKILIAFTDGEPNHPLSLVTNVIKRVTKHGIELYVVALGSNTSSSMAKCSMWIKPELVSPISEISDLGPALLKLLRNTLIRRE